MVLLTSETVTNAFIHGRSEARLRLVIRPDAVRIEVGDDNSRHPQRIERQDDALDGRGLDILDLLATAVGGRRRHRRQGGVVRGRARRAGLEGRTAAWLSRVMPGCRGAQPSTSGVSPTQRDQREGAGAGAGRPRGLRVAEQEALGQLHARQPAGARGRPGASTPSAQTCAPPASASPTIMAIEVSPQVVVGAPARDVAVELDDVRPDREQPRQLTRAGTEVVDGDPRPALTQAVEVPVCALQSTA